MDFLRSAREFGLGVGFLIGFLLEVAVLTLITESRRGSSILQASIGCGKNKPPRNGAVIINLLAEGKQSGYIF